MAESKRGGLKLYHNNEWKNITDFIQIQFDDKMIENISKKLVDVLYPVGIIIEFTNTTDPNTIIAGTTWEKLPTGYPTITSENGGLAVVEGQLPKHTHTLSDNGGACVSYTNSYPLTINTTTGIQTFTSTISITSSDTTVSTENASVSTPLTGTTDGNITITSGQVISAGLQVVKWKRVK